MTNSTPENVGDRLKQLRKGASLQEFANQLDVKEADYIAYETGRREIPVSLLVTLLERHAVDPVWMLTGRRGSTASERAASATTAYKAILEAAQRAGTTLSPEAFSYAIVAALPSITRTGEIDQVQADVLVKLATLNTSK